MLGERQAASILAVAAMLHSGRNNNFYIGSSLCRFYILCLDVANESFLLTVMTQLNREKIDLRHIDHQLDNN